MCPAISFVNVMALKTILKPNVTVVHAELKLVVTIRIVNKVSNNNLVSRKVGKFTLIFNKINASNFSQILAS
jgi:hypothetical protein